MPRIAPLIRIDVNRQGLPVIAVPTLLVGTEGTDVMAHFSHEFVPVFCTDEAEFTALCQFGDGLGLIVLDPTQRKSLTIVKRTVLKQPGSQLVLAVTRVAGLPSLGHDIPGLPVIILSEGPAPLRNALRCAWFEAEAHGLLAIVRRTPWPAALKAAIARLLRQRLSPVADDELLRTVTSLADASNVSRQYLTRIAHAHELPLSSLPKRWTVILALRRRFLSGWRWEQIAWSCGYSSQSGLSQLFKREIGHGLRDASLPELNREVEHLRSLLERAS